MEEMILKALEEKKVFIGYFMLCRYLNGRGYIRYGCNTNTNTRVDPCKILCPNTKIYRTKIYYWCKKLYQEKKISLEKVIYEDFQNPNSWVKKHKTGDVFVIIKKC